ncbi:hypothetical protein G7Y89_g12968 [Cudoniella acicularis]|uniref:Uncharacterized protein n=1 Tax=Cudoniella acicularis TaxID=354080 RepID=A0A8H4RA78_9HELO|nr:hypothetical protein G7Y89_g12968 [Cudoniella acicularis]
MRRQVVDNAELAEEHRVDAREREHRFRMGQPREVALRALGNVDEPVERAGLEEFFPELFSLGHGVEPLLDVWPEDLSRALEVALAAPVARDEEADDGVQPVGKGTQDDDGSEYLSPVS